MIKSSVINVNPDSQEFVADLKRRIEVAKNPKNRHEISKAKKNILQKYKRLVRATV